jgi:hypothetical protein
MAHTTSAPVLHMAIQTLQFNMYRGAAASVMITQHQAIVSTPKQETDVISFDTE